MVVQLRLRKDIWEKFPVNLDALEKSANGMEQYGIEWHNMKLRTLAAARGIPAEELKKELEVELLEALKAAKGWRVIDVPGKRFFTGIRMQPVGQPQTRRNNAKATTAAKAVNATRKAAKQATKAAKAAKTTKATKQTAKATKGMKVLGGEALLKKATGLLNKITDDSAPKIIHQFLELDPETPTDFRNLMNLVFETLMDQLNQIQHPNYILLLHSMDARHAKHPYPALPSGALLDLLMTRYDKEPIYVALQIGAENSSPSAANRAEQQAVKEKIAYRAMLLFLGFMSREGLASRFVVRRVLKDLAQKARDEDADYRARDAAVQGLLFVLIRAGTDLAEPYMSLIGEYATSYPRGSVRALCEKFLVAAKHNFQVEEGAHQWHLGAPGLKRVSEASRAYIQIQQGLLMPSNAKGKGKPNAANKTRKVEKLGAEPDALWKRFPTAVKQENGMYIVQIHNKKLGERFELEKAKYANKDALRADLIAKMRAMVAASDHWAFGPDVGSAEFTILRKA